ncbi:SufS family cysteine desulfurase [Niveispirillum sp. SYP-B3756]|uniref:aminotransferase class V-fold PLP-dependent enzyme n=1 Tax=Niveispirillum sp. SYP-B3756 TaxID=2662178 RepID=UPI0012912921|nr:cysteine desulfurase [Niveispirillum sp. SYP-B3756]MQP67892.1 SufS family cysteine desulfurase [Niveispirillum sp. SYP-B3756]
MNLLLKERATPAAAPAFDPEELRQQFPIFARNPGLVFLDTAASAQKPVAVIDGLAEFYRGDYANVHRGVYRLSARSTQRYEAARETVARFLNAAASEIVFVRGATEGINLVAQSWGPAFLKPGDQVLVSELEHHSNIVPWQMLRQRLGIELVVVPIDATGGLDMVAFARLLGPRTRLVAVTHVANVSGCVVPVVDIVRLAHEAGARVLLDGCQAVPRLPVDVRALGCDFYVFSGHKCYGPTGIGALYAREGLLDAMPPWQGGGDMIRTVCFEETTYQDGPQRFEAGTPDISGAIGLALALDFMTGLGGDAIRDHEADLTRYAEAMLGDVPGVSLVGAGDERLGAVSFLVDGIHPHDLATIFDQYDVAVRAGHHCAQPLMDRLGLPATTRASFGVYSTRADVDALVAAVRAAQKLFGC